MFKCCQTKTTNNIRYINCGEIFHYFLYKSEKFRFVSEKFSICCKNEELCAELNLNNKNSVDDELLESEREIELLKRIVLKIEEKYK